jgi:hypothetical protein
MLPVIAQTGIYYVGFVVLTVVVMKNTIFWYLLSLLYISHWNVLIDYFRPVNTIIPRTNPKHRTSSA